MREGRTRGIVQAGRNVWTGLLLTLLVNGCREPTFEAQAYLVNRTDQEVLVEVRRLTGECPVIWQHGLGVIREDDFEESSDKVRLPPNHVQPLSDCAARIALEGAREDITWDPELPDRSFHDPPQPEELADRTQRIDIVTSGDELAFELSAQVRRMSLLAASAPAPPSVCPQAAVPRLGVSTLGSPMQAALTAIEERDGCLVLHMAPRGVSDPEPQPATVYACMPRELLPFAVGDELRVASHDPEFDEHGILLDGSAAGVPRGRVAVFVRRGSRGSRRMPEWPTVASNGARRHPIAVTPSSCGLVRDPDGLLWQPLEVGVGGAKLTTGVPQTIRGVTYYVGRAMRIAVPAYRGDIYEWVEVYR